MTNMYRWSPDLQCHTSSCKPFPDKTSNFDRTPLQQGNTIQYNTKMISIAP